jgi:hypothetical protein
MDNWKKYLKLLKLQYLEATATDFFNMSGGYSMEVKPYTDKTANGLTRAIEDFAKHSGGYSNRISTTGTMRKINGVMKYTKGNSNKGAADVRILFNGRSVDVEVKIGRDVMSEAQKKEKKKVEAAGGLYMVAKTFPDFLQQWQDAGFTITELKQRQK